MRKQKEIIDRRKFDRFLRHAYYTLASILIATTAYHEHFVESLSLREFTIFVAIALLLMDKYIDLENEHIKSRSEKGHPKKPLETA